MKTELMTLQEVLDAVKMSKTKVYSMIKDEEFPAPIKFGERVSRWSVTEIDEYLEEKLQSRDIAA